MFLKVIAKFMSKLLIVVMNQNTIFHLKDSGNNNKLKTILIRFGYILHRISLTGFHSVLKSVTEFPFV